MKNEIVKLIKAFGLDVMVENENEIMIDFGTIITLDNNKIDISIDGDITENISYTDLYNKIKELYM